jgi:hypothetical protein
MKNLSKEDMALLIAYGAITVAYGLLFYYKYKHTKPA